MPLLGQAHADGEGVSLDPVEAARWFIAALAAGNGEGLDDLHELARTLTPEQLRTADRLAGGDGSAAAALIASAQD
jgi:TPR repeat protein